VLPGTTLSIQQSLGEGDMSIRKIIIADIVAVAMSQITIHRINLAIHGLRRFLTQGRGSLVMITS